MKKLIINYDSSCIEYKFKDSVNHMNYVTEALMFGEPKKITLQKYPLKHNEIVVIYERGVCSVECSR